MSSHDMQPFTPTHLRNVPWHRHACSMEDIQLTKGRWVNERTCEETEWLEETQKTLRQTQIEIRLFPFVVGYVRGHGYQVIREKLH